MPQDAEALRRQDPRSTSRCRMAVAEPGAEPVGFPLLPVSSRPPRSLAFAVRAGRRPAATQARSQAPRPTSPSSWTTDVLQATPPGLKRVLQPTQPLRLNQTFTRRRAESHTCHVTPPGSFRRHRPTAALSVTDPYSAHGASAGNCQQGCPPAGGRRRSPLGAAARPAAGSPELRTLGIAPPHARKPARLPRPL